jgi:hypothetical protein
LTEEATLDFEKMEAVCRDLGFYDDKQSSKALLVEMWGHLQVDQSEEPSQEGTVRLNHVKVFLAAILNFSQPWMKQEEGEEERVRVNPRRIGSHMGGRYTLTEEEIAFVTKRFVLLHSARQDHLLNSKKEMHMAKLSQEPIEFRPKTDPKSKKMLEKKDPKSELG